MPLPPSSLTFQQPLIPLITTYHHSSEIFTLCSPPHSILFLFSVPCFYLKYQNPQNSSFQSCSSRVVFLKVLFIDLSLLILNTNPLHTLIQASSVDHHQNADNTQLFTSFSLNCFSSSVDHLLEMATGYPYVLLNGIKPLSLNSNLYNRLTV